MKRIDIVLLTLTVILAAMLFGLYVPLPSVQAASEPDIPDCIPMGKVGNEVLYFCESDYGLDCVWDPSPALGAGVMDCD